jgi:5'-methylthioadenosine phosphorylase
MTEIKYGVIGGSGVYKLDNLEIINEISVETPFGSPSDKYIIGKIGGIEVAFLARHNRSHNILPGELNSRANIYGFKSLGVKYLLGVSAVGSLREEIKPGHIVFPYQIIDRTKGRKSTFFGKGIVAHVAFANPFCPKLTDILAETAKKLNITFHKNKTYICMEGPAFSTKAESNFHRLIGGDIIGMTVVPEAKLSREAEICYATIALSTDYDCWRESSDEHVTAEKVVEILRQNSDTAKKIIQEALTKINFTDCECMHSLESAIMTDKKSWPDKTKEDLKVILKRFGD